MGQMSSLRLYGDQMSSSAKTISRRGPQIVGLVTQDFAGIFKTHHRPEVSCILCIARKVLARHPIGRVSWVWFSVSSISRWGIMVYLWFYVVNCIDNGHPCDGRINGYSVCDWSCLLLTMSFKNQKHEARTWRAISVGLPTAHIWLSWWTVVSARMRRHGYLREVDWNSNKSQTTWRIKWICSLEVNSKNSRDKGKKATI